jgi:HPt (histidine-containing phosphotransfer) domain-containing protein
VNAAADPSPEILDAAALRRNFDGDLEFMGRLLGKFEVQYPRHLERIRDALNRGDGAAAAEEAHRLAGATTVFFAQAARQRALGVEDFARAGKLGEAAEACAPLLAELHVLADTLRGMSS